MFRRLGYSALLLLLLLSQQVFALDRVTCLPPSNASGGDPMFVNLSDRCVPYSDLEMMMKKFDVHPEISSVAARVEEIEPGSGARFIQRFLSNSIVKCLSRTGLYDSGKGTDIMSPGFGQTLASCNGSLFKGRFLVEVFDVRKRYCSAPIDYVGRKDCIVLFAGQKHVVGVSGASSSAGTVELDVIDSSRTTDRVTIDPLGVATAWLENSQVQFPPDAFIVKCQSSPLNSALLSKTKKACLSPDDFEVD